MTRMKPILDGQTYLRVGSIRTGKIVIYPIADNFDGRGDQFVNWVAEIETSLTTPNDWNRRTDAANVLPMYAGWHFDWLDVPAMIANAEVIFEYPMVDKDPIDQWTFGRVTLAGDAAHPMYPRGSNGSAQALIDVRTLADCLTSAPLPQALADYENLRRETTAAIVRTNRSNPPDFINIRVEELTGDKPFDDLSKYISQEQLRTHVRRLQARGGLQSCRRRPMNPVLHGYYRSSAAFRVRIALALKGIEAQTVYHHLRKGEQRDTRISGAQSAGARASAGNAGRRTDPVDGDHRISGRNGARSVAAAR